METVYIYEDGALRPKRVEVDSALFDFPDSEVYSHPDSSDRPVRIKSSEVGESGAGVYIYGNGKPVRIIGNASGFYREPMVLVIDTNLGSGTDFGINFNGVNPFPPSITVDWGDGTINSYEGVGTRTHTYAQNGEYTIRVSGKLLIFRVAATSASRDKITHINSWGELGLVDVINAFRNTTNLQYIASPATTINDMTFIFRESQSNPSLSHWDVSNITLFERAFQQSSFNQDMGMWELHPEVILNFMYDNSAMSAESYSRTLIGWANNIYERGGIVTNRTLGAVGIKYAPNTISDISGQFDNAVDARNYLINDLGWTINDDGGGGGISIAEFESTTQFESDTTLTTENTEDNGTNAITIGDSQVWFLYHSDPGPGLFSVPSIQNQNGVWAQLEYLT